MDSNGRRLNVKQARWCKAYTSIVLEPRLTMGARLTLIALRAYCSFNKDVCWPSTETLCVGLGCERKALFRYLHELESHHFIRRRQQIRKNKAFSSSKYELLDERKALVNDALPRSQKGDTARLEELPSVKYGPATREKQTLKKRKILRFPCPQKGNAIKKDQDVRP